MATEIKIQSCKEKKKTDTYCIYDVVDSEGKHYDCFEELKPETTYSVEITPNGAYNPKIKVVKDKKQVLAKDYAYEKRRSALDFTVQLIIAGKVELKQLESCRDKFFNYLNGK